MNVEQVAELAVASELLTPDLSQHRCQQWSNRGGNPADGAGFVNWLASERDLTDFQASALLAGVRGPYMFGPYRVSARIMAGRLGDVFRAEHVEFQQPVSLKIFPAALSRNPERLARLGREARVSLQVEDLHAVRTYHVGRVGEVPFIAFEALNGETLEHRLAREGKLGYEDACQIIQQAALGLAYLHSQDIIHRDVCPANLWITPQGLVKLMEFGAARDALAYLDTIDEVEPTIIGGQEESEDVLGRYDYMSAEQAQDPHAANVASDLYSLGCTLYHSLTGQVPFPDRNPVRQMLRHANEKPKPLATFVPGIPGTFEVVISKLLAKRPQDRYATAEQVAADLANIVPWAVVPELEAVNVDFLEWLETGRLNASQDVPEVVEYEPEYEEFLDFVTQSR